MEKTIDVINISNNIISESEEENGIYDSLIEEVKENRINSRDMLKKIKEYTDKVDIMLPDTKDFRNKWSMESKIKTISELFSSQLSIVKAIDDSVKTEFDLRKKATKTDSSDLDVFKLAEAIELMERKKQKIR